MKVSFKISGGLILSGTNVQFAVSVTNVATFRTLSDAQLEALLELLAATPTIAAEDLPRKGMAGTYYSLQHPDWPPLPGDMSRVPVWNLGDFYLLNDVDYDYDASAGTNISLRVRSASGLPGFGDESGTNNYSLDGLSSIEDYGTNLWIAQTHIANGWLAGIGSNTLADVEYEIQSKTNLLQSDWFSEGFFLGSAVTNWTSFTVFQGGRTNLFIRLQAWADDGSGLPIWWQWRHFGHGSVDPNDDPDGDGRSNLQEYQAGSNPLDWMIIAWGNNSYGQCDVPIGLTNAIAVAGGGVGFNLNQGFTLVLRDDGTIAAWGNNIHGQTNVPSGLTNVIAINAGIYQGLALRNNGTVSAWGSWWDTDESNNDIYPAVTVPSGSTNVTGIAAGIDHDLALRSDGSVVAWSYYTNLSYVKIPTNLPPVKAVAAGWEHSVALLTNGSVVVWGENYSGFYWNVTNVPSGLSNVVAIAAGSYHTLALKSDGTVVAWGEGNAAEPFPYNLLDDDQSIVPSGLSNVVAVAAGGYHSMALKSDGTVVMWGNLGLPGYPLNQLAGIAAGETHALALRGGRLTPIIMTQPTPTNQAVLPGATVTISAQVISLAGTTYQWQFEGVNISGATNATLTLTGVTTNSQGAYRVIISNKAGSIVSSNATLTVFDVTPPIIISVALPTNPVAIYAGDFTLSVTATAHGQSSGFPLHYQWQTNGVNINGMTATNLTFEPIAAATYSVVITNAVGSTNASWDVTTTFVGSYIDVGTFAYHLSTNAVGHANGFTGTTTDMEEYTMPPSVDPMRITNAVWSTNFWLKGVQGLSATAIGYSNELSRSGLITMVSPRHYLFATHMHPEGYMTAFLDTNNVLYWRTTLQRVDVTNDTSAGILNADLPPSVGYLPVLPTTYTNYIPLTGGRVQGIGMNQDVLVFGQPMIFGNAGITWNTNNTAPFGLTTNWNVPIQNGDSSCPERLLVNNQLILVSANTSKVSGNNYAFEFDAINQKMHYLSTNNIGTNSDYQLTPFSLTNWPVVR